MSQKLVFLLGEDNGHACIGNLILIAVNNRFLMDTVRACDCETVKLSMSSALTSMNIEPNEKKDGEEEIFMLLPVRMKE